MEKFSASNTVHLLASFYISTDCNLISHPNQNKGSGPAKDEKVNAEVTKGESTQDNER